MTKNKLRASYTVLRLWEQGKWEDAIKTYFYLEDKYVSEAMADGKEWHEQWAEEIRKTNCMPKVFGGEKLAEGETIIEKKMIVPIYDWLDLSFIMDLYNGGIIRDWKTGVTNSQDYLRTEQMAIYGVGAIKSGLPVKKAEIHHYNQHTKEADMSIVWMTEKTIQEAFDYLTTYGSEIYNYFVENDLFNKFGHGTIDGKPKDETKKL